MDRYGARELQDRQHINYSADDISSASDSDPDYQTDLTTPACSEINQDDMAPDDVDEFRDREYPQLKGKTYLDHGGTTLYAKSLMEEFCADMVGNLYGNPHSASSPSALAGHRVDAIRERALRFFNADPEEYDLVFVANATAAIKLVIECFRDNAAASNTPVWYGYHKDAHTSLVGVRESTKMHRCFTSDEEVDLWINSGGLGGPRARQLGLFAYPGQSNMTGRRLPLNWPGRIRQTFHKAATYTLLDAAALASTAPLDLSDPATAPDFVALSFYKIFGFPNIGALIVRKDSAHVLKNRKYFGGGTVDMIISINDTWHAKKDSSVHDRLEDGTLPFHSIFALDHAMTVHERLYGNNPMKFISMHTALLGKQLYDGLSGLRHSNGLDVCTIYKDDNAVYGDPSTQGATVAFNIRSSDGNMVGYEDVEQSADARNIFVRSGALCNPGGVATYLDWSPAEMKAAFAAGHRCSSPTQVMLGKPTGVVRVSLGAMSTSSDVKTLLEFLNEVYVDHTPGAKLASTAQITSAKPVHISNPPLSPTLRTRISHMSLTPAMASPDLLSAPHARSSHDNSAPARQETSVSAKHSSALPFQEAPATPSSDRLRAPPFVPSDYTRRHRPWEEQMGKYSNVAMEIKVQDMDDGTSSATVRNQTPSVKARKFGRSMVNLLRTKSHTPSGDHTNSAKPPTPPPALPPLSPENYKGWGDSITHRHQSRREIEQMVFQRNADNLGKS